MIDRKHVGAPLPGHTAEVEKGRLRLFAKVIGETDPIYTDEAAAARAAGMGDVFAQGMLVMAWAGRAVTAWARPGALREFGVRFTSVTRVGDVLTCTGRVVEKREEGGERRVRVRIEAADARGDVKVAGEAVVALP